MVRPVSSFQLNKPEGKVQVEVQVGQKHGQKCKKAANTKVHVSMERRIPQKKKQTQNKETVMVDSGDESSEDKGDEVDAYELLQEQ